MSRVLPLSLRSLLLVTGLGVLAGCQTPHSSDKVRPERPAAPAPAAPRALPEGSAEGVEEHLLHEYAGRETAPDAEVRTWDLPAKAKRLVVELLVQAARDDVSRLPVLLTEQARWGVPDRREYDARPVFEGDDGRGFLDTLRNASARFSRKENLNCPPIMPPAAQTYVRNGAEPMWCFYGSNDGLDVLAFKMVLEGGSAKVDYIGIYPERPTRMIPRQGPQPPPMTPIVRRPPGMPSRTPDLPPGVSPIPPGGPIVVPGAPPVGAPDGVMPIPGLPQPGTQPVQPGTPTQPGTNPAQPGTNPAQPGSGPNKPVVPKPGDPKPAEPKPVVPKPADEKKPTPPKPVPAPTPKPTPAPDQPAE